MSDEMITLSDEQAAQFGFATESAPVATSEATNVTSETPAAEADSVTAPTDGKPTESASPKPAENAPPVNESGKQLYTPEELAQLLKTADDTGKINLDTSRLSPEGVAVMKSFQQGFGPKFEQAKKMREEAEAKLAEFNRRQKEIEDRKIFEKEVEEHGEEEAARRKEMREIREEQAQLRWERDQARQRELSMQIGNEYRQVAPKYHIPNEQVYEDIALANKWTMDIRRAQAGQEPLSMEEGNAMFADAIGLTNVDNLWKIIRANPENEKAVRDRYVNEYIKDKAKGPTVSPSSVANVQAEKKAPGEVDPNKSTMDLVREALGLAAGEEIKLT